MPHMMVQKQFETEDPSSDSSDIYTEDPGTETEDMPDTEEISNTDTEDTTASDPESILENYVEDTLSKETPSVSWKDTQIPFTYGESSASALTGRLAVILEDLDGDGTKELLEVEAKDGDLAFNIYKAEGWYCRTGKLLRPCDNRYANTPF